MRCFVTGASGYIGSALCAALVRDGHEVVGQVRHGDGAAGLAALHRADLTQALPAQALAGVECLFHLAGVAHQSARAAEYRALNLDATLALARQAAASGVRRFIFMSSVKALGSDRAALAGQSAPALPAVTGGLDYGRSKYLAEEQLRLLCRDGAMELVILRPALVYSPEAPGHLHWLQRWAAARLPAPPAGGARSMIARDDLVRLCVDLVQLPLNKTPLTVTVTDGEKYSTRRLHAAWCRSLDRRPLLPGLPRAVWRLGAWLVDRVRGEAAGTTWSRLTGDELYSAEGLAGLGFVPRLTFERSLGLDC